MSAAVNGAVDFYDTTDPSVAGWGIVGGTSEASPLFSGIVALADQVAGHSLGYLNPALYAMAQRGVPDGIVPISQGTNTYTFCIAAARQEQRFLRLELRPRDRPWLLRQRLLQRRDRVGHGGRCLVRSGPGPLRQIDRAEPDRP